MDNYPTLIDITIEIKTKFIFLLVNTTTVLHPIDSDVTTYMSKSATTRSELLRRTEKINPQDENNLHLVNYKKHSQTLSPQVR